MLEVKNISISFNNQLILDDVSFVVSEGEKIAIIGQNGSGKSTLLKTILSKIQPESGEIKISDNLNIGYLPQDLNEIGNDKIVNIVRNQLLEMRFNYLGNDNSDIQSYNEKYDTIYGYQIEKMWDAFGLEINDDDEFSTLSTGQKTKVLLSILLVASPDLLILDEPTNNLDIPSIIWLEEYLKRMKSTLLIISHDKKLLDKIVDKLVAIDRLNKNIDIIHGSYDDYYNAYRNTLYNKVKKYHETVEEISRLKESIQKAKRHASSGSSFRSSDKYLQGFKRDRSAYSAKKAKAMETRLEKIDAGKIPIIPENLKIEINPNFKGGNILFDNVVVGYKNGFISNPISFNILYGDRAVLMGANGSGKSTLINSISNKDLIVSGSIAMASEIIFGHLTQQHDELNSNTSPIEYFSDHTTLNETETYGILEKFGISPEDSRKKFGELSPGQKTRIVLAIFQSNKVNFLLLDEPTNHLDIESQYALNEALNSFTGTILAISHDREFISNSSFSKFYIMNDGALELISNYSHYIDISHERSKRMMHSLKNQ